jgi:hypothetical protein
MFSVRINRASAWLPALFAFGESKLQEVRLNLQGFTFGCRYSVDPGIVLIMHLMLIEEPLSRVIGNTDVPSLRITAFPINELQYFQGDGIYECGHAKTIMSYL